MNRLLSEKGVIVTTLAVKDLVEKFARHESSVANLRDTLATHEKGLMQLTEMLGSNKTMLKMDLDALKNDFSLEQKRFSLLNIEFTKSQKEITKNIPLINSRLNVNEARRHEIERDMMQITDRLPPNIDVLLTTLEVVQERVRVKTAEDEKRLRALEVDTVMLKKKQNLPELEHRLRDRIDDIV